MAAYSPPLSRKAFSVASLRLSPACGTPAVSFGSPSTGPASRAPAEEKLTLASSGRGRAGQLAAVVEREPRNDAPARGRPGRADARGRRRRRRSIVRGARGCGAGARLRAVRQGGRHIHASDPRAVGMRGDDRSRRNRARETRRANAPREARGLDLPVLVEVPKTHAIAVERLPPWRTARARARDCGFSSLIARRERARIVRRNVTTSTIRGCVSETEKTGVPSTVSCQNTPRDVNERHLPRARAGASRGADGPRRASARGRAARSRATRGRARAYRQS